MINVSAAKNSSPKISSHLLELLVCPLTKSQLRYDEETNELVSDIAGLAFPIVNGIPIMLVEEARKIPALRETEPLGQK